MWFDGYKKRQNGSILSMNREFLRYTIVWHIHSVDGIIIYQSSLVLKFNLRRDKNLDFFGKNEFYQVSSSQCKHLVPLRYFCFRALFGNWRVHLLCEPCFVCFITYYPKMRSHTKTVLFFYQFVYTCVLVFQF